MLFMSVNLQVIKFKRSLRAILGQLRGEKIANLFLFLSSFSCENGQCIPNEKVCNFIYDCDNKMDEFTCPASCDLESGDTCAWYNGAINDMSWQVWQGKTPSTDTGPPYDHTNGNATG